ncbi:hypothetical protein BDV26DRAFT_265675 [Aspergillus bertholletiae]|uniref:Uncharacterized protein n=1 Tax=Aspergillus bertholletiae TaxID=1226010 RepID=A0A5N7B308_9EURO|nr:hypothetical protein BDV26DRAFT_265675 [Aspergillus bertholletiae]
MPDRPETDYERWLRQKDEHFKPGDRPSYGPNMQGIDHLEESGAHIDRDGSWRNGRKESMPHGYFIGNQNTPSLSSTSLLPRLNGHSIMCSLLLSVIFAFIILKSAKAYRKRRRRGGAIRLSDNVNT